MTELINILNEVNPGIDYETATGLMTGGILDSMSVVAIIGEVSGAFDVQIPVEEIKPENFDSAAAMIRMIERIKAEG